MDCRRIELSHKMSIFCQIQSINYPRTEYENEKSRMNDIAAVAAAGKNIKFDWAGLIFTKHLMNFLLPLFGLGCLMT